MSKNNIMDLKMPERFVDDPITDILRNGARTLLAEAQRQRYRTFQYTDLKDEQGRRKVVRNGYLPERKVQTGIGPVPANVPRVRDRQAGNEWGRIRFRSSTLPPYLRKTKNKALLFIKDCLNYDDNNPAWKGTVNTCTIYDLDDNTTYYFVSRAYDIYDNESENSVAL